MYDIDKTKVAVLCPVYNEADHLGVFLERLKRQNLHVLIVDDGSTDRSFEIARSSGVEALKISPNAGKGNALRKGFKKLIDTGFEWVIILDSDGQHLPEEIPGFIQKASEDDYGLINGNRLKNPEGMPFIRYATNCFMSYIVSLISGQRILDSQCGYKMISTQLLKEAVLSSDRFEIEDEIILEASKRGYKIASHTVTCVYGQERSHIDPIKDTIRFLKYISTFRRIKKGIVR